MTTKTKTQDPKQLAVANDDQKSRLRPKTKTQDPFSSWKLIKTKIQNSFNLQQLMTTETKIQDRWSMVFKQSISTTHWGTRQTGIEAGSNSIPQTDCKTQNRLYGCFQCRQPTIYNHTRHVVFSISFGFIYKIILKSSTKALQKILWEKHFRHLKTQDVLVHSHMMYEKKQKASIFTKKLYWLEVQANLRQINTWLFYYASRFSIL